MSIDFSKGVNKVRIKVLTTNTTDVTLLTNPKLKDRVIQPMRETVSALAEHGLSLFLEIDGRRILYDFGGMGFSVLGNLKIFQIEPNSFEKAILSHGHFDHYGSMFKLLPEMGKGKEIIVSPHIYEQKIAFMSMGELIDVKTLTENYKIFKKEKKIQELPVIKKKLLDKTIEENEQNLIETNKPIEVMPGVWTSGEIKIYDNSDLTPNLFVKINKNTFKDDTFRDEIALYINVKNKGLIVITGCGHTGIRNIIKHGIEISGIDNIYAIIGGFHLAWSSEQKINEVIEFFKRLNPKLICGMHCTGFKFNSKLLSELPDISTLGVVGTTFTL